MARPTRVLIDRAALLHNLMQVKKSAHGKKIIAMVKANAYGCGLQEIVPTLTGHVDAFGVACIEEALAIRALDTKTECVLFQGIFSLEEMLMVAKYQFQCVIHQPQQLRWLLETPLANKVKVWVKMNTGMNRLGFPPDEVNAILTALSTCSWVDKPMGLMTHLACADEPQNHSNQNQLYLFHSLDLDEDLIKSVANSAAILSMPDTHEDVVRPGIMLYGVSPFSKQTGVELGLKPVMRFMSAITAINHCKADVHIGYGGTWRATKPTIVGIVAVGYGDGYPRHIDENTPVWVNGNYAPIIGKISMDMMTIDLSDCPGVEIGMPVELWGDHIPVERIAKAARTIAYELLCQISSRARN